jgi:hypothetical protein
VRNNRLLLDLSPFGLTVAGALLILREPRLFRREAHVTLDPAVEYGDEEQQRHNTAEEAVGDSVPDPADDGDLYRLFRQQQKRRRLKGRLHRCR